MKKAIFGIMAILTIFAMVSCGGGGGGSSGYTVTFDADGGSPTPAPAKGIPSGGTVASAPTAPTKAGYEFGGWVQPNGDPFLFGSSGTPVTANITVKAKWTAIAEGSVQVIFNGNGGTPESQSKTLDQGTALGSTVWATITVTRTGYNLVGWATTQTATAANFDETTVVTANITVYAVWAAKEAIVEEITLANGWSAIFKFELPAGKTWADITNLKADYMIEDVTTEVRARVFGLFTQKEIEQVKLGVYTNEDEEEFNIAVVGSWPSGDSGSWIMDNSWPGLTKASELFFKGTGEDKASQTVPAEIEDETWFTVDYGKIGLNPHAQWGNGGTSPEAALTAGSGTDDAFRYKAGRRPADNDAGTFYLAVGLIGTTNPVTSQVKNVKLVGSGFEAVGEPLYFEKGGELYRAYNGQLDGIQLESGLFPNLNGGKPGWKIVSGASSVTPVPWVELDDITITFDLNYPNSDEEPAIEPITVYPGTGVDPLPSATPPSTAPTGVNQEWVFDGWFSAPETGGYKVVRRWMFDEDTTVYARWSTRTVIPNATADLELTGEDLKIFTYFGGLGSGTGSAGPWEYDVTQDYDAQVWFGLPTATTTATYANIVITYNVTRTDSGSLPLKLAFHANRASGTYSGGTTTYEQQSDTAENITKTIAVSSAAAGVVIQHNTYNDESGSFELKITKIVFTKP